MGRARPLRWPPGPCLIPMAMLEFTRAGQSAKHGLWGAGRKVGWERHV